MATVMQKTSLLKHKSGQGIYRDQGAAVQSDGLSADVPVVGKPCGQRK